MYGLQWRVFFLAWDLMWLWCLVAQLHCLVSLVVPRSSSQLYHICLYRGLLWCITLNPTNFLLSYWYVDMGACHDVVLAIRCSAQQGPDASEQTHGRSCGTTSTDQRGGRRKIWCLCKLFSPICAIKLAAACQCDFFLNNFMSSMFLTAFLVWGTFVCCGSYFCTY